MLENQPSTAGRENNFGVLRLVFATLVILSHSAELIDGNRSREILHRIFGSISFGDLAVDGFFLISGYLITQSWLKSGSNSDYLLKRVMRIYPGYIVAYLFSLVVIGPLAGGHLRFNLTDSVLLALRIGRLDEPLLQGVFAGLPCPVLNGSIWTISYEFRCYVLLMALGTFGVLKFRKLFLAIALAIFVAFFVLSARLSNAPSDLAFVAGETFRFYAMFICGSFFFVFRDRIPLNWRIALASVALLLPLMFVQRFAEIALAVLGGYFIFWFSFCVKSRALNRIGTKVDLSYGLYLYSWPIQNFLLWSLHIHSPYLLFGLALVLTTVLAYCSWTFIEQPCLRFVHGVTRRIAEPLPDAGVSVHAQP